MRPVVGLYVDGVPVAQGARRVQFDGWGSMHTTGALSGSNYATPGLDGEVWRPKRRGPGFVSARFRIVTTNEDPRRAAALANAEWESIVRMFPRRRPVLVSRVHEVLVDGVLSERRQVASAELADVIAPSFLGHHFRTGELTFKLLDGCWYTDGDWRTFTIESDLPRHVPVSGTTDTHRIVVTFSGAHGPQRLTNVTAGVWMESPRNTTFDPLVWDVERFTAIQAKTSALASSSSSGDEYAMILDPDLGQNRFALTGGGTAVISWKDAWS